jgi:hypothetical protein
MRVRQLAALVFLIFALIPGVALAWRARHFEHLGYFHDDGMYWIAAKSLAEGTGYRILSLPGMPYQTKYPPGLPFLLSLVWKVSPQFPANLPWAMLIAAAMLPAFAWVSVRLLESWGCSRCAAMVVCAWMVLNPYIVLFGVSLMPELLVATLLGCCLLAAQKAVQQDSTRIALASGILGGLAYLTKTAAMPLLIAGPIWFALRRRSRLAWWFVAPLLASVVVWTTWSTRHTAPSTDAVTIYYTSYVGDYLLDLRRFEWVTFVWKNLPVFLSSIGNLLIPDMKEVPLIGQYFPRLVGLFAITGIVRRMRQDSIGLQHWFAGGYSLLVLVWQYPPNERFLIPILPLFAYGAQAEVRHLAAGVATAWRSDKRDQRAVAGMFAAIMVAVCLWASNVLVVAHLVLLPGIFSRYHAILASNRRVYEWINLNLAHAEPILTYYDAQTFLYTGHPAMRLPNFPKQYYRQDWNLVARTYAELPVFARSRRARYLLLGETDRDDPFLKGIVDWKKLTSGASYHLLVQQPMAEFYEIEPPR